MSPPVDLAKTRWLALCDLADMAALRPERHADELPVAAGRLTTVTAVPHVPADTSLITSFRWDCTAYGLAPALSRVALAPGLQVKAQLVRALLTPPDPNTGAVAVRVAPHIAEPEPEWVNRADCGRG